MQTNPNRYTDSAELRHDLLQCLRDFGHNQLSINLTLTTGETLTLEYTNPNEEQ